MQSLGILQEKPIRVRKVRRRLLYKEVSYVNGNRNLVNSYFVNRFRYHEVPLTFPFWRQVMFFLRYFIWSYNISMWLFKMAFIGQFGLKGKRLAYLRN